MVKRTIEATLVRGYQVEVRSGDHTWLADEPVKVGGENTGPDPYELLLGSLAACTCITVAMYCRRKELPLESVSVRFVHQKVHADDCEECERDATGYLDHVETHVEVRGDFTDEQRQRVERVVTHCPVHKTLQRGVHFDDNVTVS